MEISYERAKRFADSKCPECKGEGWFHIQAPVYPDEGSPTADIDEDYCMCVKSNMAEWEAEMREEE